MTSPEVLIFLFFMITDPKTAPAGSVGRVVFGVLVAVTSVLLMAPRPMSSAPRSACWPAWWCLRGAPSSRPTSPEPNTAADNLRALVEARPAMRRRQASAGRPGSAAVAGLLVAASIVAAGIPARGIVVPERPRR